MDVPEFKNHKTLEETEKGAPLTLSEVEAGISKMAAFLDKENLRRVMVVYCISSEEVQEMVASEELKAPAGRTVQASWVGLHDVNGPGFMKGLAYAIADGALTFGMPIGEMCAHLVTNACALYSALLADEPDEVKQRVRAEIAHPLIIQIGGPEMSTSVPISARNIMEQ